VVESAGVKNVASINEKPGVKLRCIRNPDSVVDPSVQTKATPAGAEGSGDAGAGGARFKPLGGSGGLA
jgi:hypothetical protein